MINLLPYNERKDMARIGILRAATMTLWGFILLALIGVVLYLPTLNTINSRYTIAKNQVATLETSGAMVSPINIANLNTRTKLLTQKLAATIPAQPLHYIGIVRTLTLPGISLSGFSISNADTPIMAITGTAVSRDTLQSFVDTLQKEPSILTVDSPISNFVKSANSQFIITVTFRN